jgi:phospholipase C
MTRMQGPANSCFDSITTSIKISKQYSFQSKYAITTSLFLISALILIGFLFPLTYGQQQINTLYNPATNPIKHIVVIMQENRSFDNYFGTYPGANGIPKGTACMPLSPSHSTIGCVKPFLSTSAVSGDLPHVINHQ